MRRGGWRWLPAATRLLHEDSPRVSVQARQLRTWPSPQCLGSLPLSCSLITDYPGLPQRRCRRQIPPCCLSGSPLFARIEFNLTAQIKSSISSSSLQINKSSSSSAKDFGCQTKAAELRPQPPDLNQSLFLIRVFGCPPALLCKTHAMRHKHGNCLTHGCKPHLGACEPGVLRPRQEPAEHASRHACPVSSFKPELLTVWILPLFHR